jgi:hypothetical protein
LGNSRQFQSLHEKARSDTVQSQVRLTAVNAVCAVCSRGFCPMLRVKVWSAAPSVCVCVAIQLLFAWTGGFYPGFQLFSNCRLPGADPRRLLPVCRFEGHTHMSRVALIIGAAFCGNPAAADRAQGVLCNNRTPKLIPQSGPQHTCSVADLCRKLMFYLL